VTSALTAATAPVVSVIVPAYNVAAWIREAVSSLRAQTLGGGIAVRKSHLVRLRNKMSQAEQDAALQNISALEFHVAYAERLSGRASSARHWFLESWRTRHTAAAVFGALKSFIPRL